ncbi:cytochrome C biogenesis protein CcdA, partial [Candidatus Micrarchaeota archaeon]|nr:cytochrome C biogenesis protein CcdA [Candidatus Micrarchaeota archaeon]
MVAGELNWLVILGAAAIDSINPCAFGVLIFLLAYLGKNFKKPNMMLLHGITYIVAVYITYLLAG